MRSIKHSALSVTTTLALAFVSLLLLSSPSMAQVPYWRVQHDRITVVANGNAQRCNRLAFQLLAFERVLQQLANLDEDFQPPPMTVYSLHVRDAYSYFYTDSDERRETTEQMTIFSKYLPGPDSNTAAIVDDGSIEDPWQSVLLLYAQNTLAYGPTRRYPVWYQLGVSNLLNGLYIENNGSILLNRNQIFEPVDPRDKQKRIKYDLAGLLQIKGDEFSDGVDIREFARRAREWAQFGLLTTAERRTQFFQLAKLMRQGAPVDEAVNEAFGMPIVELSAQFEDRRWLKEAKFRLPAPADIPPVTTAVRLDTAEAKVLLEALKTRVQQQRL